VDKLLPPLGYICPRGKDSDCYIPNMVARKFDGLTESSSTEIIVFDFP